MTTHTVILRLTIKGAKDQADANRKAEQYMDAASAELGPWIEDFDVEILKDSDQ